MSKIAKKYGWFAHNLRELRAAEDHLSQGKLAKDLGMSTATIQHIEDGTSKSPSVLHLCAIADYFSVPIGDFLQKDLSTTSELDRTITFVREAMTKDELIQLYGAVAAVRRTKRDAGHYRRDE